MLADTINLVLHSKDFDISFIWTSRDESYYEYNWEKFEVLAKNIVWIVWIEVWKFFKILLKISEVKIFKSLLCFLLRLNLQFCLHILCDVFEARLIKILRWIFRHNNVKLVLELLRCRCNGYFPTLSDFFLWLRRFLQKIQGPTTFF